MSAMKDIMLAIQDKLKPCRYCGELFLPNSPRQVVCKKDECQRRRKNDKAWDYYVRKRIKQLEKTELI